MNIIFRRSKRKLAVKEYIINTALFLLISWQLFLSTKGLAQQIPITPITPKPTSIESVPIDGLFFADIIVRGRPIFQVGSVGDVSAIQRQWGGN